jgi:hypothetical protein
MRCLAFMRRATVDFVDDISKKISTSIFIVIVSKQRNFLWHKRLNRAQTASLSKFLDHTPLDTNTR